MVLFQVASEVANLTQKYGAISTLSLFLAIFAGVAVSAAINFYIISKIRQGFNQDLSEFKGKIMNSVGENLVTKYNNDIYVFNALNDHVASYSHLFYYALNVEVNNGFLDSSSKDIGEIINTILSAYRENDKTLNMARVWVGQDLVNEMVKLNMALRKKTLVLLKFMILAKKMHEAIERVDFHNQNYIKESYKGLQSILKGEDKSLEISKANESLLKMLEEKRDGYTSTLAALIEEYTDNGGNDRANLEEKVLALNEVLKGLILKLKVDHKPSVTPE